MCRQRSGSGFPVWKWIFRSKAPDEAGKVHELAGKYGVKMQEIALAWHWMKGVSAPLDEKSNLYITDGVGAVETVGK